MRKHSFTGMHICAHAHNAHTLALPNAIMHSHSGDNKESRACSAETSVHSDHFTMACSCEG